MQTNNNIEEKMWHMIRVLALAIAVSTAGPIPTDGLRTPGHTPTPQLVQIVSYETPSTKQLTIDIEQLYQQKRIRHMEFVI